MQILASAAPDKAFGKGAVCWPGAAAMLQRMAAVREGLDREGWMRLRKATDSGGGARPKRKFRSS